MKAREGQQVKLTPRQHSVLAEMAKPNNRAHYMKYMGRFNPTPYWFVSSNHDRATKQIETLLKLGLLERIRDGAFGRVRAVINDAGRAALARSEVNPAAATGGKP